MSDRNPRDEVTDPDKDPGRQVVDDSRSSEAARERKQEEQESGSQGLEKQIEDLPGSHGGL